jgi:hypothetical protein
MPGLTMGATIAGYRVDGLAGHGGMGVVYRATQLSLARTVALKLIAPELASDQRFRERFKRESRLAAAIDHPNVLPVYEAGEADGTLFIAMRWVEGTDLGTLIKRGGGLEPGRAAAVIAQVGAALDAAHQLGLVHRDVKPANVLITAGAPEHVYLTDFGLVKRIASSAQLTQSGQFVGTVDYIAPEQIRGTGNDLCADVYALGCVLFHCLSGRVPFEADSEIAKIYAHLNEAPPVPSEIVPRVPPQLDGVVARAMAKEPADRYRSAGDLGRAALAATGAKVSRNGDGATPTRRALSLPKPGKRPQPALGRTGRHLALSLGLAAVLAAVTAGVLLARGGAAGDDSDNGAAWHIPPDGSLIQPRETDAIYVMKAGAKFRVPPRQRTAFGYERRGIRTVTGAELRRIPDVPRDDSLVRAYRSTLVWRVRGGKRHLTRPPPGADVAIVPSTGLQQVPVFPGGRRTSVSLAAPSFIQEARPFNLVAHVISRRGVPTGACVFYRIGATRLKERANTPVDNGTCTARLRVSGFASVRYSVHFVGHRGWSGSAAATAPIEVMSR